MSGDSAFGCEPPLALGVEEELLLVNPETHALSQTSDEVLPALGLPPARAKEEFYAGLLELTARPAPDAEQAARELGELRAALRRAGAAAIGAGLHPSAAPGDVRVLDRPRYRPVLAMLGEAALRTPEAALHVHVSVPDAAAAISVHAALRERAPLVLALAAASPFRHGADTGYASARMLQNLGYPRYVVPRAFRDWDDYRDCVSATLRAAEADDYTALWWLLRPHPRLGTVELRVMDSQSSLGAVAGIAALVQGLAAAALDGAGPAAPTTPEALSECLFRAAHHGLDARLSSPGDGAPAPARELAAAALVEARGALRAHGLPDDALGEVERLVRDGGPAAAHRSLHRAGGIGGLLAALRRETCGQDPTA